MRDFLADFAAGGVLLLKTMKESQTLLADYVQNRSEEAFAQLLKRYVDLVYSTAMRLVRGDSHLAEDVAQTVFLHLAAKAGRLPRDVMLGGWLHQDTCFVASKMLRGERRRQLRERHAAELSMQTDDTADFTEIAPVLDEAINQLEEEDRKAILLRFYEQLEFRAIGEQLGSSENAAQKRVSRALERLHAGLIQRGIGATLSAAALGSALAGRAVEAAPVEVVVRLGTASLAGAAAGHETALTFLKSLTASKVGVSVAGAVAIAGASWLAWSLWGPWLRPKPPPLALNGTWTRLNKPQPLGYLSSVPWAFALDPDGRLYVADDEQGGRIQRLDHDGKWRLVASAGQLAGGFKGGRPLAMAFDALGALYVLERVAVMGERIERRDREGRWTTLEGPLENFRPENLTVDQVGNLYVSGWGGKDANLILLRKPDGTWVRLAEHGRGLGEVMGNEWLPLAIDAQGNLYVSDSKDDRIQRRDVTGRWSEIEVDLLEVGRLRGPWSIVVDASGALYVAESERLLKRDADGQWSELASQGRELGQVSGVRRLAVDSTGALYVGDSGPRIQKRDSDGSWTLVCTASTEPGSFCDIMGCALDSHGSLYVVDNDRQLIQKRDPQGHWTVVFEAANGPQEFGWLTSIAVDRQDNLYVADYKLSRVMMRDSHGSWELCMPPGTGIGETALPDYISVDASDNLYVVDDPAHHDAQRRLQKRDRQGNWTVVMERGREPYRQLGNAYLGLVTAAPNGNIYAWVQRSIWMRDSKGRWTGVAERGHNPGQVSYVRGMATDSFGRLYVSESDMNRVQVRDVNGKWYELSDVSAPGHSELPLGQLAGLAVDRQGVAYVVGSYPPRVLRWTPQPR